jgi:hypothetical protein
VDGSAELVTRAGLKSEDIRLEALVERLQHLVSQQLSA